MGALHDRVVVVTGAGRGLGRAHALALAAAGAAVVVNDAGRAPDGAAEGGSPAEQVVAEIQAMGGRAVASDERVDLPDEAEKIVGRALDTFGRIDGVVNNAGFLRDASFAKLTDEQWHDVIGVHLHGTYYVTHAAWPHLRSQGAGRVVMTTSHAGIYGNFGQSNYGAAKSGVVGLANVLAIEGRRHGITVNVVAPLAASRLSEAAMRPEFVARLDPRYVAALVTHLMSPGCTDTGLLLLAGAGTYARYALCEGDRVHFDAVPTPAELAAAWGRITDLTHPRCPPPGPVESIVDPLPAQESVLEH